VSEARVRGVSTGGSVQECARQGIYDKVNREGDRGRFFGIMARMSGSNGVRVGHNEKKAK